MIKRRIFKHTEVMNRVKLRNHEGCCFAHYGVIRKSGIWERKNAAYCIKTPMGREYMMSDDNKRFAETTNAFE